MSRTLFKFVKWWQRWEEVSFQKLRPSNFYPHDLEFIDLDRWFLINAVYLPMTFEDSLTVIECPGQQKWNLCIRWMNARCFSFVNFWSANLIFYFWAVEESRRTSTRVVSNHAALLAASTVFFHRFFFRALCCRRKVSWRRALESHFSSSYLRFFVKDAVAPGSATPEFLESRLVSRRLRVSDIQ